MTQARQPKGIPTGGEFAKNEHGEAAGGLSAPSTPAMDDDEIRTATDSAIASLIWSDSEADEYSSETGEEIRASDDLRAYLTHEIQDFAAAYPDLVEEARQSGYTSTEGDGFAGAFGHDFVMTRQREGVGFWDRTELAENGLGDRLTAAVQGHGEISTYIDDGAMEVPTNQRYVWENREDALDAYRAMSGTDQERAAEMKRSPLWKNLSYVDMREIEDSAKGEVQ